MVQSRISKRMRALGLDQHTQYLKFVSEDSSGAEMVELLDAISTNTTHFFRENDHFVFVTKIVKEWLGQGTRRLRVWSAASSTGEEPYSLAMTLYEAMADHPAASGTFGPDFKILATDINTQVLAKCKEGTYSADKTDTIPTILRQKYFSPVMENGQKSFEAKKNLKDRIAFKRLNLSQPPFPMKGPLDFVMCRNVMIYFDNKVRERLIRDIYRLVKPGGYLLTGHAEGLVGIDTEFRRIGPSIYQK